MAGPLSGVRVLDMGAMGVGPASCGLMALMGADVIRMERHVGDGLMFVATRVAGMGAGFIGANFNKKSIVLNWHDEADRGTARKLIAWADILVENRRFGATKQLGFDYESVKDLNPGLIYLSSPAYGTGGPLAESPGAGHFIAAAAGYTQLNGCPGGPPEMDRYTAYIDMINSVYIVQGALAALNAREKTGKGQLVSTCSFNGAIALQMTRLAEFFATGQPPQRLGSADPNIVPSQAFRTLDNSYILVTVSEEAHWPRLCRALELDALAADPRFSSNDLRLRNQAALIPLLEARFRDKPRMWWLLHLRRCGVPCGYVAYYQDVVNDPHIVQNRMIVERETPWGRVLYVNPPWQFSLTPAVEVEAAHLPGADRREVLARISQPDTREERARGAVAFPLEGVRVLDLSREVCGAVCCQNLGDLGAEVIKVEGLTGDWSRHVGPSQNGENALFLGLNRNKKSVALDAGTAGGRELLDNLIRQADIVVESSLAGAAGESLLGYDKAKGLKHNTVYCLVTPYGEETPYRDRPATELEIQGVAGLVQFLGEPGRDPVRLGADAVSVATGVQAADAVLAALYHRQRTGFGQKVSVSMLRVALWFGRTWITSQSNPDSYNGYFLTGPYDRPEMGFKTADKQLMFSLFTGTSEHAREAWVRFCEKVGITEPYNERVERCMRAFGLGRDADELKPLFEAAFKTWKADDLVDLIHGVGGVAASYMTYPELFGDPPHPQVKANEMVAGIDHPKAGRLKMAGIPLKFRDTPVGVRLPPPLLGQHTAEVIRQLGYSAGQITGLEEAGCIKR
ncbi:MAG: CoA transferase [Chloroflexi bacterium]|nr:CoA transferase [Chloroflexota bacterium]